MSSVYGLRFTEISDLTLTQFNVLLVNIPYVSPMSSKFGDKPEMELESTPLTRYADRCGVDIPREVHLDLLRKPL